MVSAESHIGNTIRNFGRKNFQVLLVCLRPCSVHSQNARSAKRKVDWKIASIIPENKVEDVSVKGKKGLL